MENEARMDAAHLVKRLEDEARERALHEAQRIIAMAIEKSASDYVAEFVANMNPIVMLTARDVMSAGKPEGQRGQLPLSASVTPDTPLSEVMDALSKREGTIGVIDKGAVTGSITADDIVRGLTRHRR